MSDEKPKFKPMLAKEAPADLSVLSYPQVVQPKLDGIRATVVDGELRSRSMKLIPNAEIQAYLSGRPELEGFDGEIVVGDPSDANAMQNTTTVVMSKSKPAGPDWHFYVFDYVDPDGNLSFTDRWLDLCAQLTTVGDSRIKRVKTVNADDSGAIDRLEAEWLDQGYEGLILRDPEAPYKQGRSGKKGPLLKLKRFIDFEAKITGCFELMHNGNEKFTNELGRGARSTAKAGLVPTGTLGGFYLEALNGPHGPKGLKKQHGDKFKVGTGFNAEQRHAFWLIRDQLRGQTIKIKSFPVGVKDAPRFPVFLGFRDMEIDG